MKKLLAVCLMTFVSFSAFAASGGRTGYIDLTDKKLQLISESETSSRLFIYNTEFNGSECSQKTTGVIYFSEFLAKEMYSMLLAAKASGKRVELIATECHSINGGTYPRVTSTYLE